MITQLTAEQEARLVRVKNKWIGIGLRTRTDRPLKEAWEGICLAYETAGRPRPKIHIWMESPLAAVLACGFLGSAQVRAQVRDQVSDQVSAQVRDQVRDQVSDQVSAEVRAFAERIAWWWMPGQFEAFWLSFYESLQEHCDFGRLKGLIQVAENCAFCFTFPDLVVFCASPVAISRDEQGRLHNPKGAAILFSDGWGVWAVHGVRVPQNVVEHPELITLGDIAGEQNAEIRRVKIELYGQARFLLDSGAVEEHRDDFGTLYRKVIPNDEDLVMVKVVNATAEPDGSFKDYFLRVPPDIRRARQAVAWTFNKPEMEYQPAVET